MQQPSAPKTVPTVAAVQQRALLPATPARAAVTFVLCAVYFTLTTAVVRFVVRLLEMSRPGFNAQVAEPLLTLLLLAVGLLVIARARVPELRPLSAIGLVQRPSAGREAGIGVAIGWAVGVGLLVPAALLLRMHSALVWDGFHLGAATASASVLLVFVLGRQLVLCGLPFRSLSQATSPVFASVAFAGVAGLLTVYTARGDVGEVMSAAMAQLVFCLAATRTRAIWLGGALQFAWGATVTLLFGVPSFLWPPATSVVQTGVSGPRWLTGSIFGPEAALWAALVMLAALVGVWRVTRNYAWHYTFDPIVGAGYAMDVPPPAEHTRMEQAAPLVQIGAGAPMSAVPDSGKESTDPTR